MCIGSHLAMQEMKLIVCALVGNYEVVISEGGDEEIEEIDAYTVRPKSNRLIVRWRAARV
jgi:cytochrome P450